MIQMQTQKQADSQQKPNFNESWKSVLISQKEITKAGNKKLADEDNPDNCKTKTENKPSIKGEHMR